MRRRPASQPRSRPPPEVNEPRIATPAYTTLVTQKTERPRATTRPPANGKRPRRINCTSSNQSTAIPPVAQATLVRSAGTDWRTARRGASRNSYARAPAVNVTSATSRVISGSAGWRCSRRSSRRTATAAQTYMPRNPISASEGYGGLTPRHSSSALQATWPTRKEAHPAAIQPQVARSTVVSTPRQAMRQQTRA